MRSPTAAVLAATAVALLLPGCSLSSQPMSAPAAEGLLSQASASPTDCLPVALTRSQRRPVYAHYFPQFPLSIDNEPPASDYYATHYLDPEGEKGKFRDVGGWLRDRPIPRNPIEGDWQLRDAQTEVHQAAGAGLDGFAVDILALDGRHWETLKRMLDAASAVPGFKVMLQPDMTAITDGNPDKLADKLSEVASHPNVARTSTGRVVVSPFKAENHDVTWWKQMMARMKGAGHSVALVPVLLDTARIDAYAPVSFAVGKWGSRSPAAINGSANDAARAHRLGAQWMEPIGVQDQRPAGGTYWESANTETMIASWRQAVEDKADMALLTTWNDYGENSGFAPSVNHGHAFLTLNSYGVEWFRRGSRPPIVADTLILSHRVQPTKARVTGQRSLMEARNPPRDRVEVRALLTAPATVTVKVGKHTHTWNAPAGMSAKLFPLAVGRVSAVATRGGEIARVATRSAVSSTVERQDLSYHAATSGCSEAAVPPANADTTPSMVASAACACSPLPRPRRP